MAEAGDNCSNHYWIAGIREEDPHQASKSLFHQGQVIQQQPAKEANAKRRFLTCCLEDRLYSA